MSTGVIVCQTSRQLYHFDTMKTMKVTKDFQPAHFVPKISVVYYNVLYALSKVQIMMLMSYTLPICVSVLYH